MSFIYTQSDLISGINGGVQGKIGILSSSQDTANSAVRELFSEVDFRSAIRRANLAPNLFNGIFPYQCPTDLKSYGIIDIPAQAKRSDGEWQLTTPEEFDRFDGARSGLMAIDDYNGTRVLKLASAVDSQSITVSELDSLTSGGGTWALFGDATSVAADDSDYIKGAGSLKFNISAAGGTTAGIQNSSVNSIDMTNYFGGTSAFFIWHKIASTTNITNYILRFGTDSSNYYSKTVTTQADGTAFVNGWNLLKFDVASYSTVGTPTITSIKYFVVYMTKTAGKISETDYKFDWLVLKKGIVNYVKYYSKYGWQSSAGAYKENSTSSTDLLVADTDEFDICVKAGIVAARREIGFSQAEIADSKNDLATAVGNYVQKNPSMAKVVMYDYENFVQ
jgi:hypothetical protein